MTYLVLQMIGALLIAAAFGAALLWLGQVLWGRLVAPMRAKTLEYELEEARADIIAQNERIQVLHKDLSGSNQKLEALQRAKRQLTATLDARNRKMQEVNTRLSAIDLEARPTSRESAEDLRRELRIAVQERDEAQAALRQAETRGERLRTELEVLHGFTSACWTTSNSSKAESARRSSRRRRAANLGRLPGSWCNRSGHVTIFSGSKESTRALERSLNRLGLYHFHQIARFETLDVEWLVEHIDGVPEQTIRDSWIVDASRLAGVPRELSL